MTAFYLRDQIIQQYLRAGFWLLPVNGISSNGRCTCRNPDCMSPGKHPVGLLVPQGVKNASNYELDIQRFFAASPDYNVGVATGNKSGVVVLDIDPRNGGGDTLAALEKQHSALPKTLWWKTGGGGRHIVFAYPKDGLALPNSSGKVGDGIDVKGDGGFIVAPPSQHVSGGSYSFPQEDIMKTPLAEIPAWLLREMRKDTLLLPSLKAKSQSTQALAKASVLEGQRNMTLTRLAGVLLSRKVPANFCSDLLLAFNEARCSPPLPPNEVARIIKSIGHRAFAQSIFKNTAKRSRK